MAGGLMNAAAQQMPQQLPGTPLTADQMPQQADGNKQMGAPLPPMGGPMPGMGQGNVTYPSQSGQPMMGMPNAYSNTVGQPGQGMEDGSAYKGAGGKGAAGSNGKSGA
jgi:hypothetical protein